MKILKIEEFDNVEAEKLKLGNNHWSNYEGYKITTTIKDFYLLVSNGASCCEDWGHITSEDSLDYFIGAEIQNFRCIDNADYNEITLTRNHVGEYGADVFDCAFIDFNTDKGNLQFAVYNHHNGYYGHDIVLLEKPHEEDCPTCKGTGVVSEGN